MLSSTHLLELAAIVVAGTMVGNELAVAVFFHPRISALDDTTHVRAAQALAASLGRATPFWYALTLLLSGAVAFFARPAGTPGYGLAQTAMGLFAAMIVYTVLLPVPINNQMARWRPESLPATGERCANAGTRSMRSASACSCWRWFCWSHLVRSFQ